MDAPPFLMADKPLKMKESDKSQFSFYSGYPCPRPYGTGLRRSKSLHAILSSSENSWMNYSEVP
jgi:hypothetical protein